MLHLLVSCFVLLVIFVFGIIIAHLIDGFEIIDLNQEFELVLKSSMSHCLEFCKL